MCPYHEEGFVGWLGSQLYTKLYTSTTKHSWKYLICEQAPTIHWDYLQIKLTLQDGYNPLVLSSLSSSSEGSRGSCTLTSLGPIDAASHEWSHGKFLFQLHGCYPTFYPFRRKALEHWAETWWWLCPTPVVTTQKPILRVPPLLPYVFPISNVQWKILQRTECIQRWEFIQSKKNIPVALLSSSLVPARGAVLLGWRWEVSSCTILYERLLGHFSVCPQDNQGNCHWFPFW